MNLFKIILILVFQSICLYGCLNQPVNIEKSANSILISSSPEVVSKKDEYTKTVEGKIELSVGIDYLFAALLDDGNFIITSNLNRNGIYGKIYNSEGKGISPEFQVVSDKSDDCRFCSPSRIATDSKSNFLITWQTRIQQIGNHSTTIYARKFKSNGEPYGETFQVNTTLGNNIVIGIPEVAMNDNGDFVITWMGYGYEPSGTGNFSGYIGTPRYDKVILFVQRYNAKAEHLGKEEQILLGPGTSYYHPLIRMDNSGNYVIVTNNPNNLSFRKFNNEGKLIIDKPQIIVNPNGSGGNIYGSIHNMAMDKDGNIIIAWSSFVRNFGQTIFAQIFDKNLNPLTTQLKVNTDEIRIDDENLTIIFDDPKNFSILWNGNIKTKDNKPDYGVFINKYINNEISGESKKIGMSQEKINFYHNKKGDLLSISGDSFKKYFRN